MTRSVRALTGIRRALAAAVVCTAAAGGASLAPAQTAAVPEQPDTGDAYRLLKTFDFDEQPLGNFEDTPMYWRPMEGPGLPAYSKGQFDEQVGHLAPPSFRLDIRGGSIGYEYEHADLPVLPDSDYRVEAFVRTENLVHATAVLACYLIDRAGERIPGTERVCTPLDATADPGSEPESPWHELSITIRGTAPNAYGMRLQLWALQDYVFDDPDPSTVDPIILQDVDARVWFDDLHIIRLPRLCLVFSNPGGIVRPQTAESLHLDARNATLASVRAELRITDADGHEQDVVQWNIPARATDQRDIPLPPLPPGLYHASARLEGNDHTLAERTVTFAILPDVPAADILGRQFGVDLGCWPPSNIDGAAELVEALGCGAAKVGVPMIGAPTNERETDYLRQIRELARRLALAHIDVTGVILAPHAPDDPAMRPPSHQMVTSQPLWKEQMEPVFAHCGGHLTSWQLGSEPLELREPGGWTPNSIAEVRRQLERYVAAPQTVVVRSVLDAAPTSPLTIPADGDAPAALRPNTPMPPPASGPGSTAISYWLPPELPTHAIPWHLAFWVDEQAEPAQDATSPGHRQGPQRWLSLNLTAPTGKPASQETADLARRIVLATVVDPERLYIPAPFELSTSGGDIAWQPTGSYIPLRTLMHYLAGTKAVAALNLDHTAVGILFRRNDGRHTLVLWTWRDTAGESLDLYVGASAVAVDLNGAGQPLVFDGPRAQVPLAPQPLIINDVDGKLLLLQDSFNIAPVTLQAHDPEPRAVLSLDNPYAVELVAKIELAPPSDWTVSPTPIRAQLSPGESFTQTLELSIPPRQVASTRHLAVDIHVQRPDPVDLHFDVPFQVELHQINVHVTTWWDDEDLVVEQTLHNLSTESVSFTAFCRPPQRAQQEGEFLGVPPGEARTQTYRLPSARDLVGQSLWLGIEEIDGDRRLDQLVAVPR